MKWSIRSMIKIAGSLFNIAPDTDYTLPVRRESDAQLLAKDWHQVGNDCHHVIKVYANKQSIRK